MLAEADAVSSLPPRLTDTVDDFVNLTVAELLVTGIVDDDTATCACGIMRKVPVPAATVSTAVATHE